MISSSRYTTSCPQDADLRHTANRSAPKSSFRFHFCTQLVRMVKRDLIASSRESISFLPFALEPSLQS